MAPYTKEMLEERRAETLAELARLKALPQFPDAAEQIRKLEITLQSIEQALLPTRVYPPPSRKDG